MIADKPSTLRAKNMAVFLELHPKQTENMLAILYQEIEMLKIQNKRLLDELLGSDKASEVALKIANEMLDPPNM